VDFNGRWGSNGRFQPYLIAFLCCCWPHGPPWPKARRLTLDAYWDTLTQIRDDLRAAGDDAAAVRQTAVATLSAITEIELADGRLQPINHSFLIRQLQNEAVSPPAGPAAHRLPQPAARLA
jgi:hypothetical protein